LCVKSSTSGSATTVWLACLCSFLPHVVKLSVYVVLCAVCDRGSCGLGGEGEAAACRGRFPLSHPRLVLP
jgi:hypothetical protein